MIDETKYEKLLKSLEDYRVQTDTAEFQPSVVRKAHKAIRDLMREIVILNEMITILNDRINELLKKEKK